MENAPYPPFPVTSRLRAYCPPAGYDETLGPDGQLRPGWRPLFEHLDELGIPRVEALRQQARQLLLENGITYNLFQNETEGVRSWDLDLLPLILVEEEWLRLERGLKQRHRLLELLLDDLYSHQGVIRAGIIPAPLIFGAQGYLRACHGLPKPKGSPLPWWAADLTRDAYGNFMVIGDLLQAPTGSGYALENRQILFRLLRQPLNENHVRLLLPFFTALRTHLNDASPLPKEDPRTVLLTPGPEDKLYFEHAFLANYLGLTLVQGEDLTVRNGRVHLKTLDGLHPVDVVLRMLQDRLCDPLELDENSYLGVAGLIHAITGQKVAVLNHPGAAVLENPALLAYFPEICHHFLGEELLLPVQPTWWCGDPDSLAQVLNDPEPILIRSVNQSGMPVRELTQDPDSPVRQALRSWPQEFIAQVPIRPSTLPVMTPEGFRPGFMVLRTFSTSGQNETEVMPGGLARVIFEPTHLNAPNGHADITKDVWVLSPDPVARSNRLPLDRLSEPSFFTGEISSRMAENLFWMGRYAERSENVPRLLRVLLLLPRPGGEEVGEAGERAALRMLYRALTTITATEPGFAGEGAEERVLDPEEELLAVIRTPERLGSVASSIQSLILAAHRVRERLSNDTWRVIIQVRGLRQRLASEKSSADMVGEMERLITTLAALAGLGQENMTRGLGWRFLELGRRLERAIFVVELLHATLLESLPPEGERLLLEALLNVGDSSITYRRRYRTHMAIKPFLELILLDEANPRGLASQLALIEEHLLALPRHAATPGHRTATGRIVLEAFSALRLSDPDLLALVSDTGQRTNLIDLLDRLKNLLPLLSVELANAFFQHSSSHALRGVSR
ncbi:MAG: circularly permuted type 2 ATP-grasp protein [Magnetococcales bacterium]|nr:circularly permuted type 2 ATP-grasp protein [Magnetococcales bacterium]